MIDMNEQDMNKLRYEFKFEFDIQTSDSVWIKSTETLCTWNDTPTQLDKAQTCVSMMRGYFPTAIDWVARERPD